MSRPIVDVNVIVYYKPGVIRVQIDTREGEWDAARVKAAAREIAYDRARHSDEHPEILEVDAIIGR